MINAEKESQVLSTLSTTISFQLATVQHVYTYVRSTLTEVFLQVFMLFVIYVHIS